MSDETPSPVRLSRSEWAGVSGASTVRLRSRIGQLAPGERELPAYVIAGVKRGGTSSLHEYLIEHPLVVRPSLLKGTHYFDVNHDKGWRWFTRHFPTRRAVGRRAGHGVRPIVGDVSPYLIFHPQGAARLAKELPAARVIVALRDPVQRAWSHFQDEQARGFEQRSFAAAVEAERVLLRHVGADWPTTWEGRHHSYLSRGLYQQQLARLFERVDSGNVLILRSKDLFTDPQSAMRRTYSFLGLPDHKGSFSKVLKSSSGAAIPGEVEPVLRDFFAEPNRQLAELLGRDLGWSES